MKDKIIVTKGNDQIDLYLISEGKKLWLFSQKYSMSVYNYFRNGRSVREVMAYKDWQKGPRLNKTIKRIPGMIKYVKSEFCEEKTGEKAG